MESLVEGAKQAVQGAAMLTGAALKSVKVAGVAADTAVKTTEKGVVVAGKLANAGLNTAGVVGTSALKTASAASEAAANIASAGLKTTANVTGATLQASTSIVKSGLTTTANITNAALKSTTQVTTDTLKVSANAASSAAKFSIGSVNTALNGLNNLRELGSMKGQNWVNKVRNKTIQGRKITDVKQSQTIIMLLEEEYNKVVKDLRASFDSTLDSNTLSLKILLVNIKDLYCMSVYRRLTKSTCPRNATTRKNLEAKINLQSEELDKKTKFFFAMFDNKRNETMTQFKTEAQREIAKTSDPDQRIEAIKDLFTKKLDNFSNFVAVQLTKITELFEQRTAQYQNIIDKAYEGDFSINGVFNTAPAAGGRRRTHKKHRGKKRYTRKH